MLTSEHSLEPRPPDSQTLFIARIAVVGVTGLTALRLRPLGDLHSNIALALFIHALLAMVLRCGWTSAFLLLGSLFGTWIDILPPVIGSRTAIDITVANLCSGAGFGLAIGLWIDCFLFDNAHVMTDWEDFHSSGDA